MKLLGNLAMRGDQVSDFRVLQYAVNLDIEIPSSTGRVVRLSAKTVIPLVGKAITDCVQ